MATQKKHTSRPDSFAPVLVIVESPTKATTIGKYLGDGYIVRATVGHIADIPASKKAVDVENAFTAHWELTESGEKVMDGLRRDLKTCGSVVLATDADREGELIASLVLQFLEPKVPVSRIEFHEITKRAILAALENPRDIDDNLVEAARTRRILDRLFGFEVTDVARSRIHRLATAGRVQSPAVRLLVERELERMAFVPARFWDVVVNSATRPSFVARLRTVNGNPIATGADFDDSGHLTNDNHVVGPVQANEIALGLSSGWVLTVTDVVDKAATRNPRPPLTMSALYQQAHSALGFSVAEIKTLANSLYQKSHITYPRTDNPVHSGASRGAIKAVIAELFGAALVNPSDRYTTAKGKNLQGAHEAIRPTELLVRRPSGITERELRLYTFIWQRTLATQMIPATGTTRTVTLRTENPDDSSQSCEFTASGTTWDERGFLNVFGDEDEKDSGQLPLLRPGQIVAVKNAEAVEHSTKPPARFTQGTLVAELEKHGIGRPSTYDTIIFKLRERFVTGQGRSGEMIPNAAAFAVWRMLMSSFSGLVDYEYTKAMEEQLDAVAMDRDTAQKMLRDFYFGNGSDPGLRALVETFAESVDPRSLFALEVGTDPVTGERIIVRPGVVYGTSARPYIEMGAQTLSIRPDTDLSKLTVDDVVAVMSTERSRLIGTLDDKPVYLRTNLDGCFFQWGEATTGRARKVKGAATPDRPRFAALLEGMEPALVSIDDARRSFDAAAEKAAARKKTSGRPRRRSPKRSR